MYTSLQHRDVKLWTGWIASWLFSTEQPTCLLFKKPFGKTVSCSVLRSGNPKFSPSLSTQAVSLSDWQPLKVNKLLRGIRWTGDGQRPIFPYSLFSLGFFSVLSTYCLAWLHCHNPRGELLTLRRENELPGPSGCWGGGAGKQIRNAERGRKLPELKTQRGKETEALTLCVCDHEYSSVYVWREKKVFLCFYNCVCVWTYEYGVCLN